MREFTWWRRFYPANRKLDKKYMYKGASQLLQRIEFGEFEYCTLAHESYLEERIYNIKVDEIRKTHKDIAYANQLIVDERKKFKKRRDLIMKNHIDLENKNIGELIKCLSKEFNISPDIILEEIDTFDGTTREFYFYLASISKGIKYDKGKVSKIPRLIQEQPRHIMKPKDRKWSKLWQETLNDIYKVN